MGYGGQVVKWISFSYDKGRTKQRFAETGRKPFTNCGDLFGVVFQTGLKRQVSRTVTIVPGNFTDCSGLSLEVEPETGADQMLAQITEVHITHINLNTQLAPGERADVPVCKSRRVVEIMVFDERAELWGPVVVCARDDLPRQIRVALGFRC